MSRLGVTIPLLQAPTIEKVAELAGLADEAGFDSTWDYEFYRNPFVMFAAAAGTTSRISLGTGLAAAFTRSPVEMANAAADVDELTGGRLLLGIGPGASEFIGAYHSTDTRRSLSRIREYVEVLRLAWRHLGTMEPVEYDGRYYQLHSMPLNPWGPRPMARPQIPIYVSAIHPKMMQLAGELGDGWLCYLSTPRYVTQFAHPQVHAGAKRAGRDPADIDLAAMVICSISDDRAEALRRARIHTGLYVAYHHSDAFVRWHGVEQEANTIREAIMRGGLHAVHDATDPRLVEIFAIAGTPDDARRQIKPHQEVNPHLILHTPYMPPLTPEETEDAFRGIVNTFARTAHV
jgi:alkanesulfonate monooxygenase SsuD/methylene tetrahydromethanopterin reductase-like flavin-dependent oxidoreductase (luciferase family)